MELRKFTSSGSFSSPVLFKGLKFVATPKEIDYSQVKIDLENFSRMFFKSLKEMDKELSGEFLMWLFSAELIYCDCSTKIQNMCLILEISLCTIS